MKLRLSHLLAAFGLAAVVLPALALWAGSKDDQDPAGKLRAHIHDVVADPARAAKMLAAVDDVETVIGELDSLIAGERASLSALVLDHGSTRAAVDPSLTAFNSKHEALARRCLTAHCALKAEATAAEWQKLRKLELGQQDLEKPS
jgi:hypothetical protein